MKRTLVIMKGCKQEPLPKEFSRLSECELKSFNDSADGIWENLSPEIIACFRAGVDMEISSNEPGKITFTTKPKVGFIRDQNGTIIQVAILPVETESQ